MVESIFYKRILLNHTLNKAIHNKKTLDDLLYEQYPSMNIKLFIKKLQNVMDQIVDKLYELDLTLNNDDDEDLIEIHLYSNLIGELHPLYKILEVIKRRNTSPSTIYIIEHLKNKFNISSDIFLVPSYKSTFMFQEVYSELRNKLMFSIDNCKELFPLNEERFSIVIYPFAYKNCVFTNVLAAHELAHFIEYEKRIVNDIAVTVILDPKKIDEIARIELRDNKLDLYQVWDSIVAQTNKLITNRIHNWLEELFCDLLALHLM